MKILGIVCSPRKRGNTEIMMNQALVGARSCGADTELWTTAGKHLQCCDGCTTCYKKGAICHIKDDMQELFPKACEADGIIFGSPIYMDTITAQAKLVLDRFYSLYNQQALAGKVAGLLSVAGWGGHEVMREQFLLSILYHHMIPADFTGGVATDKGDIRKDEYAMKSSEILGKAVATLAKELTERQFHWPEQYKRAVYRICIEDLGISPFPRPSRVYGKLNPAE